MKRAEFIKAWCDGEIAPDTRNSHSLSVNSKGELVSYQTPIAYRLNDGHVILNGQRYSNTTSAQQSYVRQYARNDYIEYPTQEDYARHVAGHLDASKGAAA